MQDSHITTIAQIKEFGKVARGMGLRGKDKKETYQWIGETLGRFRYFSCSKKDKSIVKGYIMAMTGLSDAQTTRLISRKKKAGRVELRGKGRHRFPRKYAPADVARLTETDNNHQRLSGPATKEILRREHEVFGKKEYETISGVSSSQLQDLIERFPFVVIGFHSDNGSEYINKVVAQLLNKMLIKQTKSRARHCNDNALAEGKNGSVVRKHMGRIHIPQRHAAAINQFYKDHLNAYLNYHRPCGFATVIIDRKGKQKKVYDTYLTPYEKLRSLDRPNQYLRKDVSLAMLDEIARRESDNECAAAMQKAKAELFKTFKQKLRFPTTFTTFVSGSLVD